jgi:hypothetical protein
MRNSERAASIWPFVITLLLLLLFVFLWFSEKGDRETLTAERDKFKAEFEKSAAIEGALKAHMDRTAAVVGFTKNVEIKIPKGDQMETVATGAWVDPDTVQTQLNPDNNTGIVAGLRTASEVTMKQDLFRPKAGAGAPTSVKVDLEKLPQGFKDKVKEAAEAFPGPAPVAPVDEDNAEEVARFESEKRAWQERADKYKKIMDELVAMKDWPAFSSMIGATSVYELEKSQPVKWQFWTPLGTTAPATLEEYTRAPAKIIDSMVKSWTEMANAQLATIDGLTKDKANLEKTLDNADEAALGLKQQLEKEQAAHTADNERLSKEAAQAKADAELVRVKATTAENALAKLEQDTKLEKARTDQSISALENRIRTDKEVREIEIQRNDPDGIVLDMNPILGVGYINLGSADKVYAGLKFEVSSVGRGGIRSPKGEVMVTRVLDAHYSQVRLVSSLSAQRPVGKGDMIANPLYSKSRPMRLYLAGELRKYPRSLAVERLSRMGVIVEDKISINTDYIVIPDSVAVGAPPPAEGEAAPEGAPATQSEYARLQTLARDFGATLITERMIESLLDY